MADLSAEQKRVLERFGEMLLRKETDNIIDLATNDEFVRRIEAVLSAPKYKQFELATSTLSPYALDSAGIVRSRNARISSRYFEEGSATAITLGEGSIVAPPLSFPNDHQDDVLERIRQRYPAGTNVSADALDQWSLCLCLGAGGCIGIGGGT